MTTTVNIELAELEKHNITKELSRRVISALATSQPVPDWLAGKAFEYLTVNNKIKDFIQQQKAIIRNSMGKSLYYRNVIIGDYGAGKTHIKEALLSELQNFKKNEDILFASLELENEYKNSNIYSDILFFPNNNQRRFNKIYKDVFRRVYALSERKLIWNPVKYIKDILLEGKINVYSVQSTMKDLGFPDDFINAFIALGLEKEGGDQQLETIIVQRVNSSTVKELFSQILSLLNKAKYGYICIFIDEFSKMEADGWEGHRESFVNEMADFHDLLGELFNKTEGGISVYLNILTYGRFWRGSESNDGLLQSALAQRFVERFVGHKTEFEIPPLGLEDIDELYIKLIALYEVSGYRVQRSVLENAFAVTSKVFNEITKANEEITPRRVIKLLLGTLSENFDDETQPWLLEEN